MLACKPRFSSSSSLSKLLPWKLPTSKTPLSLSSTLPVNKIFFCPETTHFQHRNFSLTPVISSKMNQTIEHIVLFKTKEGTPESNINEIVQGLDDLRNLENVLHLTTGIAYKTPSSSLSSFNIFLHGRHPTKQDLDNYMASNQHLSLVKTTIRPLITDYMIVDWVFDHEEESLSHPTPGSGLRVSFLKVKEGLVLGEDEKQSVVKVVGEELGGVKQYTIGENYSAVGKGFTFGALGVFGSAEELDKTGSSEEFAEKLKGKLSDIVEQVFVVDYIV